MTTNNKPNRLITEKSPYLLQHAHNPVEWFPWGEVAFDKAQRVGCNYMVRTQIWHSKGSY
ncbi:uncharacterized protein YyaL (SSP411 family) [Paenibacillus sp. V4I3]|uniref:DUF255 domain-containing protein n=1 Tax=unclassified Paenibacillus TaxID=185978 RepID=UPI00278AB218|nr:MULTISPECIES: DUF255 domain-containing protein [unclassified Paenibacillus]MDQ0875312.1 uncharacterized protein YyaL (SSP411 family) [Paenibacillus sp. V4I3]MDQ0888957.1 uncharacterized protein YyaL (SSP411 family) [Paenibacillus sp. V4I9]